MATKGDLSLLVQNGKATTEELNEAWEKIIEEKGKHTNDNSYNLYQQLIQDYAMIIAQQTVVSVCLEMLLFKAEPEILDEVRQRGYIIDLENYDHSLKQARSKCKNLITRAESKRLEIERQFKGKQGTEVVTYDEIIGYLELVLDRTVMDADTITLAKYNVLKKGAEAKQKAKYGANKY